MRGHFFYAVKILVGVGFFVSSSLSFAYWLPFSCWTNLIMADGTVKSPSVYQIFKDVPFFVGESYSLLQIEDVKVRLGRIDDDTSFPIHAITAYNSKEQIIGQAIHVYSQAKVHLRVPVVKNGEDLFLNSYCHKYSSPPSDKEMNVPL